MGSFRIDKTHLKDTVVAQNPDWFCYGIDAVLLADFAVKNMPSVADRKMQILDLCSGNAIVPVLMAKTPSVKNGCFYTAVEVQEQVFYLAQKSIELNNLENSIKPLCADLCRLEGVIPEKSFDAVTVNPPYMVKGNGRQSSNRQKMIARQEILCTLRDVVSAAKFALKEVGSFFMINRANRQKEIFALLDEFNFCRVEYRLVKPKRDKEATMILVKAQSWGADGLPETGLGRHIEPVKHSDLIVYSDDGKYTEEVNEIYGRV